jgi:hypothetical protein
MLTDIAAAYDSGRLLLLGTTALDAQLPVIWNIGAFARSGHPLALETVRRIMLASAAIPGAFPPTMFDVSLDGKRYQEMHLDGGTFVQAFLYPASVMQSRRARMLRHQAVLPVVAYVIRNGRMDPAWAAVERRTLSIAERAIATIFAASGYNDVVRIYNNARRDDIGYNLAHIGTDFNEVLPSPFDQKFMRDLFNYGYEKVLQGCPGRASRPSQVKLADKPATTTTRKSTMILTRRRLIAGSATFAPIAAAVAAPRRSIRRPTGPPLPR